MEQGELVNFREMYGYSIRKGIVTIDPERAPIVRSIFYDYLNGIGTAEIARRLTKEGAQTLRDGQWTASKILGMLKNEKYTGDALFQKKYVVDHLSKRRAWNHGERPMYFAEETHTAIIDHETFDRVQNRIAEELEANGGRRGNKQRYFFTGKIVCGTCGKNYKRITKRGKPYWQCATTVQFGAVACHSKRIPEDTLFDITMNVLKETELSKETFLQSIDHIEADNGNCLIYICKDRRSIKTVWQDRSRAESWTDEMKQQAREKTLARKGTLDHGSGK